MLGKLRAFSIFLFFSFFSSTQLSAGAEEGLFKAAKIIYEMAQEQTGDHKLESHQRVRELLDRILEDYGSSDLAVRILLQDNIEGVDVAKLDEYLRASTSTRPSTQPVPPDQAEEAAGEPISTVAPQSDNASLARVQTQQSASNFTISNETTEKDLGLKRSGIRDLQARLFVSGHDPNGVDGVVGQGTRAAIRSWQTSIGATETGYMSSELLEVLKTESEAELKIWLQNSANARAYKPPQPIALGPRNVSGTWRYTSRCGANSRTPNTRVTGKVVLRHAGGNQYSGTLTNSQGLRANIGAVLNGRTIRGTANFGLLLGRVNVNARVDEQQLVMRGRDSNRCSFYASK